MVNDPALQYINELVITAGVGWHKKEPWVNQIANGVEHDSLHDFAIEESESHPYAGGDGRKGVKIEMPVIRVSIEAVYVEDGLDIIDRYLLNDIGIQEADAEGFRWTGRGVAEQLLNCV
jgi:hypothetical protein